MALAMGMGAAGMLLTLAPSLWLVGLGLTLCCSGVFVAQATTTSYIGLAAGQGRALAVGMYVTCYYLGGSVGSELPGLLWHRWGWPGCVGLVILDMTAHPRRHRLLLARPAVPRRPEPGPDPGRRGLSLRPSQSRVKPRRARKARMWGRDSLPTSRFISSLQQLSFGPSPRAR